MNTIYIIPKLQIPPNPPFTKWGNVCCILAGEGSPLLPEAGSLRSSGEPNGVLLAGKRGDRGDLKTLNRMLNINNKLPLNLFVQHAE
jgi:hypothetical protein